MQSCLYLSVFHCRALLLLLFLVSTNHVHGITDVGINSASNGELVSHLKSEPKKYFLSMGDSAPITTNNLSHQATPVNPPIKKTYASKFSEVLLGLAFVVSLIFILSWLMKRVGYNTTANNSQLMKIKSCLPLSTKEKLMLIEVDGEHIIIGVAPGFVGHIKSLSAPINLDPKEMPFNFSDTFKNLLVSQKSENNNEDDVEKSNHGDKANVSIKNESNNVHA